LDPFQFCEIEGPIDIPDGTRALNLLPAPDPLTCCRLAPAATEGGYASTAAAAIVVAAAAAAAAATTVIRQGAHDLSSDLLAQQEIRQHRR